MIPPFSSTRIAASREAFGARHQQIDSLQSSSRNLRINQLFMRNRKDKKLTPKLTPGQGRQESAEFRFEGERTPIGLKAKTCDSSQMDSSGNLPDSSRNCREDRHSSSELAELFENPSNYLKLNGCPKHSPDPPRSPTACPF
jgi:hypothetical protein